MPRPRSLGHAQLAAAALAVIDRDGLAALSMRAVAKELGMSTMALYRYVDDREELEGLVVELVLSGVDTEPPPDDQPWRERIVVLAVRFRDAVDRHPSVIPLMPAQRQSSVALLRWAETVLGILAEAGVDGERRVIVMRGLLSYLVGALQLVHLGSLSGEGTIAISELPRSDFPYMAETARYALRVGTDEEFRGGLALLLNGID